LDTTEATVIGATNLIALSRSLPTQISVVRGQPLLTWNYATDDVGNISRAAGSSRRWVR
jgi:hypothetical protein